MTTTAEKIAVMQAFADGKAIEWRSTCSSSWTDLHKSGGEPKWDWASFDYRIKPEPREWWLAIGEFGVVHATYQCKRAAENYVARIRPNTAKVVHAREVIE